MARKATSVNEQILLFFDPTPFSRYAKELISLPNTPVTGIFPPDSFQPSPVGVHTHTFAVFHAVFELPDVLPAPRVPIAPLPVFQPVPELTSGSNP